MISIMAKWKTNHMLFTLIWNVHKLMWAELQSNYWMCCILLLPTLQLDFFSCNFISIASAAHIRMPCSVYVVFRNTNPSQTPIEFISIFIRTTQQIYRILQIWFLPFTRPFSFHSNPIFLSYHTHYTHTHTHIPYTFAINLFSIYHFMVTIK